MKTLKHIIITDSGFGGLSVLASLYEKIKDYNLGFLVKLTFIEALPKNIPICKFGYNTMPSDELRVEVFNQVLEGINNIFKPDTIAVACNTLSAILNRTKCYIDNPDIYLDIIELGLSCLLDSKVSYNSYFILLGTETTVKSQLHKKQLINKNIFTCEQFIDAPFSSDDRYPFLIETEPASDKTYDIAKYLLTKVTKHIKDKKSKLYLYLGCTHFGFVKASYTKILNKLGYNNISIINPNDIMVNSLFKQLTEFSNKSSTSKGNIDIDIISQFKLSTEQLQSGVNLVNSISPFVANKLKNYTYKNYIYTGVSK